jgi:hypothetical protein
MARHSQLEILAHGLEAWNRWRTEAAIEPIDLSGADLREFEIGLAPALKKANDERGFIPPSSSWSFIYNEIIGYDFMPLDLRGANLRHAKLDRLDLTKADCRGADFSGASLQQTNLHRADLRWARFVGADLSNADARASDLSFAAFANTIVEGTDFGYSDVYGASVWGLTGTPADETSLTVTPPNEQSLRTDGLELAQLIYLLMRNEHARDLIDTVSSRMVLLLGNFKPERMAVLTAVRSSLRDRNLMPMIFDFDGPKNKDTTGTVETLARLACLVIADLTDPSSVPHELATTVPFLRTTPVLLLREAGAPGYSMVEDLSAYPWVQPVHLYPDAQQLVRDLPDVVRRALESPVRPGSRDR